MKFWETKRAGVQMEWALRPMKGWGPKGNESLFCKLVYKLASVQNFEWRMCPQMIVECVLRPFPGKQCCLVASHSDVIPVSWFRYLGCGFSQGRSEELARAEEEQLEGIGIVSSNSQGLSSSVGASRSSTSATGGGNGGQGGQQIAPSGPGLGGGDAVAYMEDYDTSIPTLNTVGESLRSLSYDFLAAGSVFRSLLGNFCLLLVSFARVTNRNLIS